MNGFRSWTKNPIKNLIVSTSTSLDDDLAFRNTALTLLSNQHALNLSIQDTLFMSLHNANERRSFMVALNTRISSGYHASNGMDESLLHSIEHIFGDELRRIVASEGRSFPKLNWRGGLAPKNNGREGVSVQTNPSNSSGRRFFSSSAADPAIVLGSSSTKNIDWKLTEAISQVNCLTLDGMAPHSGSGIPHYEPPQSPLARAM